MYYNVKLYNINGRQTSKDIECKTVQDWLIISTNSNSIQ